MSDHKEHLVRYLHVGRDALIWKLEGLDEYDVRRPLVTTGTNLLGLVKHVAITSGGYFARVFDRPLPEIDAFFDDGTEDDADMWAHEGETRDDVLGLWERAWAHADTTIAELPLDAPGVVPWWRPGHRDVTLHQVLVHVTTELHRHAGHADIVRELIDGAAGLREGGTNLPPGKDWAAHRDRIEQAARAASGR